LPARHSRIDCWRSAERVAEAVNTLQQRDGSLIVATSRRTDPAVTKAVREVLSASSRLVDGAFPRFPVLLNEADEIFVTGDSVSMLSEAILTGKPVGLVPIEQDDKGRRKLGKVPLEAGPDARRRDLRRFWNYLQDERLIGTVEAPVAAKIENPVETAARAVRKLLGDLG
jgi:UDP-N-acetylglucosamine 2-epimerase